MSNVISVEHAQRAFAIAAAGEDKATAFVELVKSFEHDHTISARGAAAATSNACRDYDAFAALCISHENIINRGSITPDMTRSFVKNAVSLLREDASEKELPPYSYADLSKAMREKADAIETAWTKIAPALNLRG